MLIIFLVFKNICILHITRFTHFTYFTCFFINVIASAKTSYFAFKDKPWVWDIRYTKEDSHGRLWIPT